MSRGQAFVELAVCGPVVVLLALSATAAVQIADARSGLEAATQAAAAAAARAPDPATAQSAAQIRFADIVNGYPLHAAVVGIDSGGFQRGGQVEATATASVDVGWAGLVFAQKTLTLHATARAQLEPWRSRR